MCTLKTLLVTVTVPAVHTSRKEIPSKMWTFPLMSLKAERLWMIKGLCSLSLKMYNYQSSFCSLKYLLNSFLFKSLCIKNTGEETGPPWLLLTCRGHREISRAWQLVNWKVMYLAWIIEYRFSGISTAFRDTNESSTAVWGEDRGTNVWPKRCFLDNFWIPWITLWSSR